MRKILILLVAAMLLAGIGLFFYPDLSNWLSERNHSTAIQSYAQGVEGLEDEQMQVEWEKARRYNEQLSGGSIEDPFIPGSGMMLPQDYTEILNLNGIMGYIEVPSAGIRLPIFHGTGEDALKKGVGHLDATAFPIGGAGNHSVLTGHRGLPSAKLFTDLDQVTEDDIFYLYILDEVLAYRVDRIVVIEPTDTGELRPVAGEDYITLITCTPYAVNSHRLTIRGTRIPYNGEEEQTALPGMEGTGAGRNITVVVRMVSVAAVLLLTIVLLLVALRRKQEDKWRQKK